MLVGLKRGRTTELGPVLKIIIIIRKMVLQIEKKGNKKNKNGTEQEYKKRWKNKMSIKKKNRRKKINKNRSEHKTPRL